MISITRRYHIQSYMMMRIAMMHDDAYHCYDSGGPPFQVLQGFGVCGVDSLAQVDYDHCVLVPQHVVLAQVWSGRRAMEASGVGRTKV